MSTGTVAFLCLTCDMRIAVSPSSGTHSITVPTGAVLGQMLPGVGPQPSISPGIQCGTCGATYTFTRGVLSPSTSGTFVVPKAPPPPPRNRGLLDAPSPTSPPPSPSPTPPPPEPSGEDVPAEEPGEHPEPLPADDSPLPGKDVQAPDLSGKSYRELQALAKRLGIPPRGARAALEEAIVAAYHRSDSPAPS